MSNTVKQRIEHYTTIAKELNIKAIHARVISYTHNEYKLNREEFKIRALCMYHQYKELGGLDKDIKHFDRIKMLVDTYSKLDWNKALDKPEISVDNESEIDYIVAQRYIGMSKRSAEKGLEFDLTLNDVKRMIKRTRCEYTGEKISAFNDVNHPNKLTFDRIDNKKGYVKGNVAVVARWINEAKSVIFEEDKAPFALDNFDDAIKIMQKINEKLKNTVDL